MAYRFKQIVFLCLTLWAATTQAQQLSFGFTDYVGNKRASDVGMDITYVQPLATNALQFSAELRSIDWGNHIGVGVGYRATFVKSGNWEFGGTPSVHLGIAPFHPKSFFAYGFSAVPYAKWQSRKRFFVQADAGIRYNRCPAYKEYGIYQQVEFPLGIRFGFLLGER